MDNSKEMKLMLETAMKAHPEFASFDTTKNVQDQLQAMLHYEEHSSYPVSHLLKRLDEFYSSDWYRGEDAGSVTWEQLWLAFVMKQKHGKVWDGEKWKLC